MLCFTCYNQSDIDSPLLKFYKIHGWLNNSIALALIDIFFYRHLVKKSFNSGEKQLPGNSGYASLTTASNISKYVLALENGYLPIANSYNTIPKLHISLKWLYFFAPILSGLIYAYVPQFVVQNADCSKSRDIPKSVNLTYP